MFERNYIKKSKYLVQAHINLNRPTQSVIQARKRVLKRCLQNISRFSFETCVLLQEKKKGFYLMVREAKYQYKCDKSEERSTEGQK